VGKGENRVRSAKGEGQSNDEVMTPDSILGPITRVLGPIGLDPCSHPKSIVPSTTAIMLPKYAPAQAQFAQRTVYADGLQIVWRGHGLLYGNFAYSAPTFERFLTKTVEEWKLGLEAVLLVPVRTGNVYWRPTAGQADLEVRLGRVKHHGDKTHAPFHSWLLYFGPRVERAMGLGILGDVRVHPRHTTMRGR